MENSTLLKVIHAWKNINQGRSSLKRPRDEFTIPYAQWIKERVREVMFHFYLKCLVVIRAPKAVMVTMEEMDELNATTLQLRKEKEDLENFFYQVTCEKNTLKRDLDQAVELLKKSEEIDRMEEDENDRVYNGLEVVSSSLKMHKRELYKAWRQIDEWKETWMNSTKV